MFETDEKATIFKIAKQIRAMPERNLHGKLNAIFNSAQDPEMRCFRVDKDLNLYVPHRNHNMILGKPEYVKYKNKNQKKFAKRIEKVLKERFLESVHKEVKHPIGKDLCKIEQTSELRLSDSVRHLEKKLRRHHEIQPQEFHDYPGAPPESPKSGREETLNILINYMEKNIEQAREAAKRRSARSPKRENAPNPAQTTNEEKLLHKAITEYVKRTATQPGAMHDFIEWEDWGDPDIAEKANKIAQDLKKAGTVSRNVKFYSDHEAFIEALSAEKRNLEKELEEEQYRQRRSYSTLSPEPR